MRPFFGTGPVLRRPKTATPVRTRIITDGVRRLEVSEMCLGTMHFGTRIDEPTSMKILDRFLEAGGTFLDTANAYSFWVRDAPVGRAKKS